MEIIKHLITINDNSEIQKSEANTSSPTPRKPSKFEIENNRFKTTNKIKLTYMIKKTAVTTKKTKITYILTDIGSMTSDF